MRRGGTSECMVLLWGIEKWELTSSLNQSPAELRSRQVQTILWDCFLELEMRCYYRSIKQLEDGLFSDASEVSFEFSIRRDCIKVDSPSHWNLAQCPSQTRIRNWGASKRYFSVEVPLDWWVQLRPLHWRSNVYSRANHPYQAQVKTV